MLILGIESSCDETAVSVVRDGAEVLSNVIASQHDLHAEFAGVVPEIASRAHVERFMPVLTRALDEAGVGLHDIDAVAVGHRPGLIGSLLTGVSAAKALAWSMGRPLIGVDHVHAHLYAGTLDREPPPFPALGLVVSGGHSSLYELTDWHTLRRLGATIDDAVGEAYDKAASILGLPFPGGPGLDRLAQQQRPGDEIPEFPVSRLAPDSLDFSFSGLKTALLYAVRGKPVGRGRDATFERDHTDHSEDAIRAFAAGFQDAAIRAVIIKVERALDAHDAEPYRSMLVGGGVSANSLLRSRLTEMAEQRKLDLRLPAMSYCLDNAAMIAGFAYELHRIGRIDDLTLAATPTTHC
jgi:N6-L-threonylcarbamoyladenine synthase